MLFCYCGENKGELRPQPQFPSWLWSSSFHVQSMSAFLLCPLGRGWKAGVGQRPVGPTGLQAREEPVWGWRWGWYRARLGVPAPGASMICKEIPLSVLWDSTPLTLHGTLHADTSIFQSATFPPHPWDGRCGRERGVCSLK